MSSTSSSGGISSGSGSNSTSTSSSISSSTTTSTTGNGGSPGSSTLYLRFRQRYDRALAAGLFVEVERGRFVSGRFEVGPGAGGMFAGEMLGGGRSVVLGKKPVLWEASVDNARVLYGPSSGSGSGSGEEKGSGYSNALEERSYSDPLDPHRDEKSQPTHTCTNSITKVPQEVARGVSGPWSMITPVAIHLTRYASSQTPGPSVHPPADASAQSQARSRTFRAHVGSLLPLSSRTHRQPAPPEDPPTTSPDATHSGGVDVGGGGDGRDTDTLSVCVLIAMPDVAAPVRRPAAVPPSQEGRIGMVGDGRAGDGAAGGGGGCPVVEFGVLEVPVRGAAESSLVEVS
ncbi:hypothetical protein HYDPIDRAFT_189722 [Hydnomerulius pinastri MD-312]|uniref:Uncharacterized protein n=1 Tax=Hydnomerulius pinastri MD-312 TaxID=994086 RepID=A0A0C9WBU1_9AGAM|nr:hypothetical protein HYDPIDRAFT_189722 [Hydnomerulius pinastri MD-312]